jgi:hypothetical protein
LIGSDLEESRMETVDTHGTFEEAISGSSSQVAEIAERLRALVIEVYPNVVEVPWPKQKIIGYGVGPKKMSEHFCYIGAFKAHVNLGFYYGAALPDPEGLMEGTGKNLRHIKVRKGEEIDRPAVRDILEASLEERKETLGMDS